MGYVTKEQIARARRVDVLDYVLTHEPGNVRRVGGGYRLRDHESLSVTTGKWYWHSRGFGGRTALDYLTEVRGVGFVDAVCLLTGERLAERGYLPLGVATYSSPHSDNIIPNAKPPPGSALAQTTSAAQETPAAQERTPLLLPLRNRDNRRVIAYLQSRGIDKDLILDCIAHGVLYESRYYHNAVFTGKDENGKTRFAAMRGTASGFKRDADGSDKQYGFLLPPANPASRAVAACESPIDCLSHLTLCKEGMIPPFDGWRLSLGGTSITALAHFLETHSLVTHCLICTDNDAAGNAAAAKIAALPGITAERVLPGREKDWNDLLQAARRAERKHTKARQEYSPCL